MVTSCNLWRSYGIGVNPTKHNLLKQGSGACFLCPLSMSFSDITPSDALVQTKARQQAKKLGPFGRGPVTGQVQLQLVSCLGPSGMSYQVI